MVQAERSLTGRLGFRLSGATCRVRDLFCAAGIGNHRRPPLRLLKNAITLYRIKRVLDATSHQKSGL